MEVLFENFTKIITYSIGSISYEQIVSSLALLTALGALAWNIIRDFVADKVSVELSVSFGEIGGIVGSNTGLFAPAGSLPNHQFDKPGVNVQITNTGRRPIGISSVSGKLKNGDGLFMPVKGLPKMLQPYEIFSETANASQNLLDKIQKGEIRSLWVNDTKSKKWPLSKKGWKELKETSEYIVSKKHLPRS